MAREEIIHQLQVEIEDSKIRALLKGYKIPLTDENIEELLDRFQDDLDSDVELGLENAASAMADDLGIVVDD